MGKYEDLSIKKLVEGINESYYLPEIQREFVWNSDKSKFEDKVYDLFDSLMRGYPIGTMLFWEVKHEDLERDNITVLKFLNNSNSENEIAPNDLFKNKSIKLVLDGQQRITILNLSLKGVFEDEHRKRKRKRILYFNLLSKPESDKEVNERVFEFKILDQSSDYFLEGEKVWYKIKDILNNHFDAEDESKKIVQELELGTDKESLIRKNLYKLEKTVKDENISYYTIDSEKKDEEALEIFVRVNSGGVTLTYSDLLFSKIKQYWKKGNEKIDAREEFKELIEDINQGKFNFDHDFVLKTCLVLIEKDIRYQIKNFNKENVEIIKKNWNKIKESIRTVINFLDMIKISSKEYLRSNNAIIPIIYYVYKRNLKEIDLTSKDYSLIKKYLYAVLLNGVFGGQSDSILTDSREIIKDGTKDNLFPINDLFKAYSSRNKVIRIGDELREMLKEINYGTDKSRIILAIVYGDMLQADFHEDHMFPKSKMLKHFDKKIVNNISNIQPLGGSINSSKNDKSFDDWLKEPKRSDEYKKTHLIPDLSDYNEANFEKFLEKRRELIFARVKGFFE